MMIFKIIKKNYLKENKNYFGAHVEDEDEDDNK